MKHTPVVLHVGAGAEQRVQADEILGDTRICTKNPRKRSVEDISTTTHQPEVGTHRKLRSTALRQMHVAALNAAECPDR